MPYTTFSFDELKRIAENNSNAVSKESKNGRFLFTTHGGRLLGIFPGDSDFNVLWTCNDIEKNIREKQWLLGGERLWIGPEQTFFYENPRDFEGFHVPAGIDPGEYKITGNLNFENRFSILNYLNNETYDNSFSKRVFSIIDDPFRTNIAFAGVKIENSLVLQASDVDMCVWAIAQVYTCGSTKPGSVLFPVKEGALPISYLRTVPIDRHTTCPAYVRFKIDSDDMYEIAIRPEDIVSENKNKVVYVSPSPYSPDWFCIIKRSDDMPQTQEECLDISRSNPEGPKGSVQAFNSGPDFIEGGRKIPFGEISIQSKKGEREGDQTICVSTHELLTYIGSKNEILELAGLALQIKGIPEVY